MAAKPKYDWKNGARLDDHSRRKLKVLREYFADYISIRCQLPQQERFRLAIVDGFCGGGRYSCGTAGSPIVFVEQLRRSFQVLNDSRAVKGHKTISIECLLIFSDKSAAAIESLRQHIQPLMAEARENVPQLYIRIEYFTEDFEACYPAIVRMIESGTFQNLIFNLDQYGHSSVSRRTLVDIMGIRRSVEIFYTFAVGALIAFLEKDNPGALQRQLQFLGLSRPDLAQLEKQATRTKWLGIAERLVFECFKSAAPYVSPFSINNPEGWRYWLLHFANSFRARQVYNNILHANSGEQAHFGRSGLNMHAYDPTKEGQLYLFDDPARQSALNQLYSDIPDLINASGDVIRVSDFYESIYNTTPAHSDEINQAMIENDDIQILTVAGGERRTSRNIDPTDVIRLRRQRSMFPLFGFRLPIRKVGNGEGEAE